MLGNVSLECLMSENDKPYYFMKHACDFSSILLEPCNFLYILIKSCPM